MCHTNPFVSKRPFCLVICVSVCSGLAPELLNEFPTTNFCTFCLGIKDTYKNTEEPFFPCMQALERRLLGRIRRIRPPPGANNPNGAGERRKGEGDLQEFLFFNSFSFVEQEAFEFHRVVAEELFGEFGYLGQERKRGRKSSSLTSSSSPLLFGGGGFGLPWAFFGIFLSSLLILQR